MRWFVLLMALWFCPVSLSNDNTEEDRPSVSAAERCPGGVCPTRPKRPRPRPTR